MIEIKTPAEVELMREAGRVVAAIHDAVREAAAPGVRLDELDPVARDVLATHGATSPFLGYQPPFASIPFPGVICTSVNDAVLHGIPTSYRLREGDLLSIDAGATLDGWTGDAAVTFPVGTGHPDDIRLADVTTQALEAGIAAAQAGNRLGDVSAAVGAIARAAGYGLHPDFGGHGSGRTMHEAPSVPNIGRPGRGLRLRPGLVIAIEPWFLAGGIDAYWIDDDGWTLRSTEGSNGAHQEYTVAITDDGPVVLTVPCAGRSA